ncbi:MAG: hypothetical protein RI911_401, partial [Candidatus Parcubacteria bacterium]
MRTWFGVIGALTILGVAGIVVLITTQNKNKHVDMRFEDGGIVAVDYQKKPEQAYTRKTPQTSELAQKGTVGAGWEQGIIKTNDTATKYKDPITTKPVYVKKTTTTPKQKPIEYFNVGDALWDSDEPIVTDEKPTEVEETPVQKKIRDFGNAVGTHIQTFVITHGKQNERLGSFVTQRSDADRAYVEKLAQDY